MNNHENGQSLGLATLPNLRDLGGWPTSGEGRVRAGLVFRSTELDRMGEADRTSFARLGIRTIYDLRTGAERSSAPDPVLDGVVDVHLDVLADENTAVPAHLDTLLRDPAAVAEIDTSLGDGRAAELITGTYRSIVSLPSALAAYRTLFRGLLGDRPGPSLFHCTTGKDRTGWAAAAFLSVLGVSRDDVYRDYELTNAQLLPALTSVFDAFTSAGGDRAILRALLGVDRAYLDAAFDEVERTYGTVENYFADGLGLDPAEQAGLRTRFVETAEPSRADHTICSTTVSSTPTSAESSPPDA
ncbi:tyrosine-protein phosphatase [Gordonia insulae]|uniref:Tyrosine-protein phosphatase n=1 Tax=Gordonia insulae TaxID=2420509 RepID=A0A3G8JWP0_9ACTN|nr:tyrosine-protein phosphatase [Gordonia insulae]AZG48620.1 Tyrosine-protein phosphatase [Gordonia insulae]